MELLRVMPERVRESRCDKTGLCCVSSCCDGEAVCSAGSEKLSCIAPVFLTFREGARGISDLVLRGILRVSLRAF